ncbi:MAG: BCCT family transporter [Pseudomonadota bacterium]
MRKPTYDLPVLVTVLGAALAIGAVFLLGGASAAETAQSAMRFVTGHFGWLFLLTGLASVAFAAWLVLGPHSGLRLGPPGEPPEFSTLSWIAMMFTAGIGASLVAWGFAEPIFYLRTPPFGVEPGTAQAVVWAHVYPLFHWGVVPWAMYTIPAVPVAYRLFVANDPRLRVGATCESALPPAVRPGATRAIDVLIALGIVGGSATSLGVGVPLVSALIARLTGVPDVLWLKALVLFAWAVLFGTSCYRGLKGGIRVLADINMVLAIAMIGFVLIAGPTVFILSMTTNSVGVLLDHFFQMALNTDPILRSGFAQDWTIFYWAWWLAYAPMMGLFFGRISRGRKVRELVLGIIGFGTLGTCSYLAVAGGYSLHLYETGVLPLVDMLSAEGMNPMVASIIDTLPLAPLPLVAFTVLSVIFYATCLDSSAYVLASICARGMTPDREPPRALRVIWSATLALMAGGILTAGGLETVKTGTILSALPLIPVVVLMCVALVKQLGMHGQPIPQARR